MNSSDADLRKLAEAVRLHQAGRLDDAETLYRQILAATPDDPIALINAGSLALSRNDVATAVTRLSQAVGRVPNNAVALGNLALALVHAGRDVDALAMIERALRLQPTNPQLQNTRGIALSRLRRNAEAIAAFERLFADSPQHLEAALNLGDLLNRNGEGVRALTVFERALKLAPENVAARLGHAFATALTGNLDDARGALERVTRDHPDNRVAWQTLGAVANWSWEHAQAEQAFRRAAALGDDAFEAHFGIASSLLARADYVNGFAAFEARREGVAAPSKDAPSRLARYPSWNGTTLSGTLLVYGEQGFGDVVQFARFLGDARKQVGRIVLLLDDYWTPLTPLLESIPAVDRTVTDITQMADETIAARASILSLPHLLGATLAKLPARVPYVAAPASARKQWSTLLAKLPRPRIGLAWSVFARDDHGYVTRHKSVPTRALADLIARTDASFVTLQPGAAGDPTMFGALAARVHDFREQIHDFGDTAALIANLDLVISADTAVAHVAGALGIPVWLLDRYNSCWRWRLHATQSPWYPTLRIFRQPHFGDWDAVARELGSAFQAWLATRSPEP